jgi:hypothetical protein
MPSSGVKSFELDVSDYIEEAFERCGVEVRTGYDLKTAKRSLNLLLADWANRGLNQWTIQSSTTALVAGTADYTLTADTIDVLSPIVLRSGTGANQSDIQIARISRGDYTNIPNKNTSGRPVQVFIDRQVSPTIKIWPVPDTTYTLVYDRLVRLDDAAAYNDELQVPFRFYPCLAAGLAYYLALKRAPDRVQLLKAVYEEEFDRAATEDRDRASLIIAPGRYYS